jgi:hypothetical protein
VLSAGFGPVTTLWSVKSISSGNYERGQQGKRLAGAG